MKKAMETIHDLIEEAKIRTVWWALCIFAISYFLSHTSKSMWTNIPISILLLSALRLLSYEVEFRWKVPPVRRLTYLSYLEKKKLSVDDPRLSSVPPSSKWKRKIDSPIVEAAVDEFVNKVVQDFVVDLWYSAITPDKEAPQLMYFVITDVLGEISTRLKEINLVDLLTRDMVDLIGTHIELFRQKQKNIGVEVMGTLSLEERDERLKHHLINSEELHPALISPECEYKVLQRLMGGVLATVLRRRESQCPLVQCISRELLTCLVMQPIMNLASPGYINEVIELILLSIKDDVYGLFGNTETAEPSSHRPDHSVPLGSTQNQQSNVGLAKLSTQKETSLSTQNQQSNVGLAKLSTQKETSLSTSGHSHQSQTFDEDLIHSRPGDWARVLEAATQRRTEVLAPENLENLWTKGRNYKNKIDRRNTAGSGSASLKSSGINSTASRGSGKGSLGNKHESSTGAVSKVTLQVARGLHPDAQQGDGINNDAQLCQNLNNVTLLEGGYLADKLEDHTSQPVQEYKTPLKRSSSTSDLKIQHDIENFASKGGMTIISEKFYSADAGRNKKDLGVVSAPDIIFRGEGISNVPKVKCRVVGAYFEKTGSKSFAVYSIAVTDTDHKTWFVKRRYRNFERLHRHLKDIPNYTLHLPPKRFLSSSVDDSFVHQRCIQLDQYLQDLLSIANVAEQHEVWDFLSVSSKSYSFGKSTSVMKTLAVNVDDAMDDILRQVKGVSDGLMRKVVGPPSLSYDASSIVGRNLSWNGNGLNMPSSNYNLLEASESLSDIEVGDMDGSHHSHEEMASEATGWHSDNELNSKGFPPRVIKRDEGSSQYTAATSLITSEHVDVPPEWTPPNVSVPLLNLVDNIFQLNKRGWLRRQVFWISKQILQLMMEDAIDDWLLRQIQWLRRDDIIAQGIHWVQDVLWPGGKFFIKLEPSRMDDTPLDEKLAQSASSFIGSKISKPGSFEAQLEAARRASDIKKLMLNGAPTALVSLIGHKQYQRCAKDLYYFMQSNICVKQLAYGMLELVLISIFPELQDLVRDVHTKSRVQAA